MHKIQDLVQASLSSKRGIELMSIKFEAYSGQALREVEKRNGRED